MTTATQIAAAAARKPRKRPAPSARDQQIYLDYQTSGISQGELADQYGLTQCRISQIVRRVERWLHTNEQGLVADSAARQELLNRLQAERLNKVARLALRHYHQQQKRVTYKSGLRRGEDFKETIEQILPANLQCLKVVLQANSQLHRLAVDHASGRIGNGSSEPAQDVSTSDVESQPSSDRLALTEQLLTEVVEDAVESGKVSLPFARRAFVEDLLKLLRGEPDRNIAAHHVVAIAREQLPAADAIYFRLSFNGQYEPSQRCLNLPADRVRDAGAFDNGASTEQCSAPGACPADEPATSDLRPRPSDTGPTTHQAPNHQAPAPSTTSPPAADSSQGPASPALNPSSAPKPFCALTLNDQQVSGVIDGTV